jgi:hypothetical protein
MASPDINGFLDSLLGAQGSEEQVTKQASVDSEQVVSDLADAVEEGAIEFNKIAAQQSAMKMLVAIELLSNIAR